MKNTKLKFEALQDAADKAGLTYYSFTKPMLDIIFGGITDYDDPSVYFHEVVDHGCQSGMVPAFIYNDDCKQFYIDHIDDLEDYLLDLENSLGEPIQNKQRLPHYTFVCWIVYEELVYHIAHILWPDEF